MTKTRFISLVLSIAALSFSAGAVLGGPAAQPSNAGAIIAVNDLPVVEELPGETLRGLEGQQHGFESLSFGVSRTMPGGGAPPHHHRTEEAHIVLEGTLEFRIGHQRLVASGPFIARIPAGAQHSFRNIGREPVTVVGVFPRRAIADIDPQ
ncbi:MAG: cupin domain-containing protein [Phycisphaerales bacterium]|nr:cupin domain-containing protein [Phycisphaerales bacterium]